MRHKTPLLMVAACVVALCATGCAPDVDLHGNAPSPERLAQLKPGLTKADIVALLGTPTQTSTFGDEIWYYISNQVEIVTYHPPTELQRQILAIKFDRGGTVTDVQKLGLKDGKQVVMDEDKSPTAGRDAGAIEQLIGNVGRFNKPVAGQ